jgi:hypothetical protein
LKHKENKDNNCRGWGFKGTVLNTHPRGENKWLVLVSAEVLLQFPERVQESEWV